MSKREALKNKKISKQQEGDEEDESSQGDKPIK
jgi:hypothetical protein